MAPHVPPRRRSGFDPVVPEDMRVRAELIAVARQLIEKRKFTQEMAAIVFGVTQPRVSNLMRGKIELFSVDRLISMLARAGVRIELQVTYLPKWRKRASPSSPAHRTPSPPPAP